MKSEDIWTIVGVIGILSVVTLLMYDASVEVNDVKSKCKKTDYAVIGNKGVVTYVYDCSVVQNNRQNLQSSLK